MKAKREIELDVVDLLLGVAIALLGLVVIVLLLQDVWFCCTWIWSWLCVILDVRRWPFWIWTCLGVAVLYGLLWLRTRYE